jgi:hypothetical protein
VGATFNTDSGSMVDQVAKAINLERDDKSTGDRQCFYCQGDTLTNLDDAQGLAARKGASFPTYPAHFFAFAAQLSLAGYAWSALVYFSIWPFQIPIHL